MTYNVAVIIFSLSIHFVLGYFFGLAYLAVLAGYFLYQFWYQYQIRISIALILCVRRNCSSACRSTRSSMRRMR